MSHWGKKIMYGGVSIKQEHLNHALCSFEQALTKGKMGNKKHKKVFSFT